MWRSCSVTSAMARDEAGDDMAQGWHKRWAPKGSWYNTLLNSMSHVLQASLRWAPRTTKATTNGADTQRSHQSHSQPAKILYITINETILRLEIMTRLNEHMMKWHSDDACDPKWPLSGGTCQSTWFTRGGYTATYHAPMLARRKINTTQRGRTVTPLVLQACLAPRFRSERD